MTIEFNVTLEEVQGNAILRVEGRLDATASPQLEKEISALIEKKKNRIILDFSKVEYLSSAGMRLLLSITKKLKSLGGALVIFSIIEDVMEIIKMAGFEKILNIYLREKEALDAMK